MQYPVFDQLLKRTIKISAQKEYKFHTQRRWRIDYCFVEQKLAIEIEGGIWIKGRHTRASGFMKDIEKYNEIILAGYDLLRFATEKLTTYGIATICRWFKINYPALLI